MRRAVPVLLAGSGRHLGHGHQRVDAGIVVRAVRIRIADRNLEPALVQVEVPAPTP